MGDSSLESQVELTEAKYSTNMVCVRDVNQSDFVTAFAAFLKKSGKINVPKWADYAKTSPAREMPPASDDWFYTRVAAVARQVYIKGELGVGNLSTIFGSAISRGMKPHHHRKGNGQKRRKRKENHQGRTESYGPSCTIII